MRPTFLYDGDCGFCTRSAAVLRRYAPADVEVVPWQFADLTALGVTERQVEREVVWVDDPSRDTTRHGVERRVGGAQAIACYLIAAGGAWRVAGWLLRVPPVRWLAAGCYRLVAANRFRLPGGSPACGVYPPGERRS